jgi:Na+/H+ antiporter NhaC
MASGSDHIDHVNTQLPYAFLIAGMSSILFLIAGFVT